MWRSGNVGLRWVSGFLLGALTMFLLGKFLIFKPQDPGPIDFVREPPHSLIQAAIRSTLGDNCRLASRPTYAIYANRDQTVFAVFAYAKLDCSGFLGEIWSDTCFLLVFNYQNGKWIVAEKAKVPVLSSSWLK